MEIRTPNTPIEWEQYYDLRYRILRQPWKQAHGSERNDGDSTALHLAYFEKNTILGVVRLDTINDDHTAQIRFMAVETNQQGKGIGKELMKNAEHLAKNLGFNQVMLHARENALKFYESMGYKTIEKSHLLFDEIQHFKMEKSLK